MDGDICICRTGLNNIFGHVFVIRLAVSKSIGEAHHHGGSHIFVFAFNNPLPCIPLNFLEKNKLSFRPQKQEFGELCGRDPRIFET